MTAAAALRTQHAFSKSKSIFDFRSRAGGGGVETDPQRSKKVWPAVVSSASRGENITAGVCVQYKYTDINFYFVACFTMETLL